MNAIDALLSQGLNHQEVANQAAKLGIDKKQLSKYLANVADAPLIQGNRTGINVLQGYLLTLNTLAVASLSWLGWYEGNNVYYIAACFGMLITLAFWYGISRHRASAYVAVCCMTALASMQALRVAGEAPLMVSGVIAANLVLIALAARLKLKLFPNQNFFNNRKAENGNLAY